MLGAIWNDDKLMSIIAGLFFALAMVLLGYACVQWIISRPVFELRRIELRGDVDRINLIGFQSQVVPQVRGSFFSANLQNIRKLVEAQPWVRKASIQRAWPNGLRIQIEEHTPLATWGESRLVNTFGEVFSANLAEAGDERNLAELSGPVGSEAMVAKMYVKASERLKTLGMWPEKIELSDRYGWSMDTDTGLHIELGREQENFSIDQKMERLLKLYPRIEQEVMPKIVSIDLRYPRGVAIKGDRMAALKVQNAASVKLN